jgi:hypothetical protein
MSTISKGNSDLRVLSIPLSAWQQWFDEDKSPWVIVAAQEGVQLPTHLYSQRAAAKVRSSLVDCRVISARQGSTSTTNLHGPPHFIPAPTLAWFQGLDFTLEAFDGCVDRFRSKIVIPWNGLSFCWYKKLDNQPGVEIFLWFWWGRCGWRHWRRQSSSWRAHKGHMELGWLPHQKIRQWRPPCQQSTCRVERNATLV